MSIYVEIRIRGSMDDLWRLTQTPDLHGRWDLRFTDIKYLPRSDETQPQRFVYATRIGFGLAIQGQGETIGERDEVNGPRTSALKFWSDDSKSLIREGAGYWRYLPTKYGLSFCTSFDYRVRFGAFGLAFDALVFRPLLGWATAWSFDRLRLWIEKGIDPAVSLQRSLIHTIARIALAVVWLYQGVIPKLVDQHADELAMIQQGGISAAKAHLVAQVIGWSELILGMAMLFFFHQRWHFLLTIVLVTLAMVSVAINSPQFLLAAFNPVSLNVLMIALALIGLLTSRDLPSARHCLRIQPKGEI
jgi:DoxX-like family